MKTEYPLPPMPLATAPATPAPSAPPRRRRVWPWILGIVVALGIGGFVSDLSDQTRDGSTSTPPVVNLPIESGRTFQEAATEATPLLMQAANELESITATSAISSDVTHLNQAAALLDQAGSLFEGVDDTQAMYLHSSADHLRSAAIAEAAYDATTFGSEMDAATGDLEAAEAALP